MITFRRDVPHAIDPKDVLKHNDHPRPRTRREFLAQGFIGGTATAIFPSVLAMMLANPKVANALSNDLEALKTACGISNGAGYVPFFVLDMAGGANFAGSNVMVGGPGGQLDPLSAAGYGRLGLPQAFAPTASTTGTTIDQSMGVAFAPSSAMLAGIKSKIATTTADRTNGTIMAVQSNNDTNTNPLNPLYAIAAVGAKGALVQLAGSQASVSGGNSVSPASQIKSDLQPTKIATAADVRALAPGGGGTGPGLFGGASQQADTVALNESIARMSKMKIDAVDTLLGPTGDTAAKLLVQCNYVKPANTASIYNGVASLDPMQDLDIVGAGTSIFTAAELQNGDLQKVAAMIKLIVNGHGGAGAISFGGYDYHTGNRTVGDGKDRQAGVAIGAILEYAARKNQPVVVHVISDGSVNSNMMPDPGAGGKFGWQGDNGQTASSFFLVFNPAGRPVLTGPTKNQIGYFKADGTVMGTSSVCANSPLALTEVIAANYLALHNQLGRFATLFPNSALSSSALLDSHVAFAPIRPM